MQKAKREQRGNTRSDRWAAGLYLFFALIPTIAIFSGMAMMPALAIFFLFALADAWRNQRIAALFALKPLIMVGLVFAVPLLSSLWAVDPAKSIGIALRAALVSVLGVLSVHWAMQARYRVSDFMARIVLWGLAIAATLIIVESIYWVWGSLVQEIKIAMRGGGGLENYTGIEELNRGIVSIVLFVWGLMALCYRQGWKWLAAGLPFVALFLATQLLSTGALLGISCGIITWLVLWGLPKLTRPLLVVGLPLGILLWPLLFPLLGHPDDEAALAARLPLSSQHRLVVWDFAMDKQAEKPWFGWGVKASPNLEGGETLWRESRTFIMDIQDYEVARLIYMPAHPHSYAIQWVLEMGWIGFALAIAVLAWGLCSWMRSGIPEPYHRLIGAVIVTWFAIAMTNFGLWQYWFHAILWLSIAVIALGAPKQNSQEKAS